MHNELNDDWINNFEKTDKLYQDFYKDDLYYVNLKFVYLNRENEIEKIKVNFLNIFNSLVTFSNSFLEK